MEHISNPEQSSFSEQLVGRTLLKDFFWSFLVAQGSENAVQQQLFLLLRDQYANIWGNQRLPDVIATHDSITPTQHLRPPQDHGPTTPLGVNTPQEYAPEFARVWGKFGQDLASEQAASPYELGRLIIQKDAQYVLCGRPSTLVDGDRGASLYRQHVLLGDPLKSENITHALRLVRQEAAALNPKVQTPKQLDSGGLQLDWEALHPGQQFYPDDLAYLAKTQTQV